MHYDSWPCPLGKTSEITEVHVKKGNSSDRVFPRYTDNFVLLWYSENRILSVFVLRLLNQRGNRKFLIKGFADLREKKGGRLLLTYHFEFRFVIMVILKRVLCS